MDLKQKNELFRIAMLNALASITYWMELDNMNKRTFYVVIANFTCISFFLHGYKYLPVYWLGGDLCWIPKIIKSSSCAAYCACLSMYHVCTYVCCICM